MKKRRIGVRAIAAAAAAAVGVSVSASVLRATTFTWTTVNPGVPGAGAWNTASNWNNGAGPVAEGIDNTADFSTLDLGIDSLVTLDGNHTIGNLTIGDAAGANSYAFSTLNSSTLTLRVSAGSPTINVVNQTASVGFNLAGAQGFTKTGAGTLVLSSASNPGLSGPVVVASGTLSIRSDAALGAAPAVATPGSLVIGDGAMLKISNSTDQVISATRGVAVGPSTGSGVAQLNIDLSSLHVASYGGAITNQGSGSGGIMVTGQGFLSLTGANTYSGPTIVRQGFLNAFYGGSSPLTNTIPPTTLTVGNAAANNYASQGARFGMTVNSGSASQVFVSTRFDEEGGSIGASTPAGTSATLALGSLEREPGAIASFGPPSSGAITTTTSNVNGILGGWAIIGPTESVPSVWASVNASQQIVPYTAYTDVTGAPVLTSDPTANVRWRNSSGNATLAAPGTSDINTLDLDFTVGNSIEIGPTQTLRLGASGGILFESSDSIGTAPDRGTLTAGGAPNTPGEIAIINSQPFLNQPLLGIQSTITDNGSGPVDLVIHGSVFLRGSNTYSGGTRIAALSQVIAFTSPTALGTGEVTVGPGAWISLAPGIVANDFRLSGGIGPGEPPLRTAFGPCNLSGQITLLTDVQFASDGMLFSGRITGAYGLQLGSQNPVGIAITLSSPANDYTGDTRVSSGTLRLGASEVLPDGPGKGNVIFDSFNSQSRIVDLNGAAETINGLLGGNSASFIENDASGTTATLTLGANSTYAQFGGVIRDNNGAAGATGQVKLVKIGNQQQILALVQQYTGGTTIAQGTLATAASNILPDTGTMTLAGGTLLTNGHSDTAGPLLVTADSDLDLGNGASILHFAISTSTPWSGLLHIDNWTGAPNTGGGTDAVFFGTDGAGLTADQLMAIRFTGFAPGASILPTGEIVPTPEPATILLLAPAGVLIVRRRRG